MFFKSLKYRRFSAIFLDLVLISLLTSLLFGNTISNPYYNDYKNSSKEYTELISNINPQEYSTPDGVIKFKDKVSDALYKTSKTNIFYYVWFIVLSLLYFVVFQYSTGGKTLGKKLYKLKVVNSDDKKNVSFFRLLFKSLFIGEFFIFDGIVLISILNIVGILLINDANIFFYYNAIISLLGIILEIILLVSFFKSKNNETILDKVFKTKVIEVK
jgi:uncharacterized RDD family membrane protein YckC